MLSASVLASRFLRWLPRPMTPSLKTLIRYPVLGGDLTFKKISFDLSEPTLVIVVLPQNWLSTGTRKSLVNEAE